MSEETSEEATSAQNGAPELPQDSTAVPAGDIPAEVAASSGGMERASPDQPAEIEDEVDSDEPEFEEAEETVAATSEPAQGGTEPSRPASAPRRRRRRRRGRRGRGRPQTPVAAAAGDVAQPAQPTPPTPANSEDGGRLPLSPFFWLACSLGVRASPLGMTSNGSRWLSRRSPMGMRSEYELIGFNRFFSKS